MRRLVVCVLILATGCSSGFTQEEVDQMVADAVANAIAEQERAISEEEAEAQVEQGVRQASLFAAVGACSSTPTPYITVDEGGLVMEGRGNESPGVSVDTIVCVLNELNIPDSVLTRISNTNSQMGLVEGSWANYSASWSYHPDNGLFIHVVAEER